MTFFRSEEHLRNWAQYDPETEDGIIQLADLVRLFSSQMFRRRLEPDYLSRMREYSVDFMSTLHAIGKVGPFWSIKKP